MLGITGGMVYYWFACKRKLWLFIHNIEMESNSDDVLIGRELDHESYGRKNKHITIDDTICIDYISADNEIHEIKKSRKIEDASIWQVKYYMWYLKEKGMNVSRGIINYPLLKQKVEVVLEADDDKRIVDICKDIRILSEKESPPPVVKMSICSKCAYKDLCLI